MNIFELARQKREKALADAEGGGAPAAPDAAASAPLTMSQSDFFRQPAAPSPDAQARSQKALADMLRARKY